MTIPLSVNRTTESFPAKHPTVFKEQLLNWVSQFSSCSFLDNHQYASAYGTVECLAAAGAVEVFSVKENILSQFSEFLEGRRDWLFGHISYDLKNEIESLHSAHTDGIDFPDLYFFRPETVVEMKEGRVTISTFRNDPGVLYEEILAYKPPADSVNPAPVLTQPRIGKAAYLSIIRQLQQHILRGDCYEINFCQEFFAEDVGVDPLYLYQQLTARSPNPFACFYRLDDRYLLCASPERYLQKKGNRLISQPIKGTVSRDLANPARDQLLREGLQQSEKDRNENVMIVDLVRNDLSRICKEGTVAVQELFGVYSFPQVHQMISTITGELREGMNLSGILQASFPMGSMTGAPKKRVMELIEQYEKTKRGIYSGAIGYIDPAGDFDFNVVIRSIAYHASHRYLNYQVGGGITFQSNAEQEYEECLLKAAAIREVLQDNGSLLF